MITASAETGGAMYDQLTPDRQEFFDGVASRLATGDVLFVPDSNDICHRGNLDVSEPQARRLLTTHKSQHIMNYLNVALGRAIFQPSQPLGKRRETYFDKQLPASELDIIGAIKRQKAIIELSPMAPRVEKSIEAWLAGVEYMHRAYVHKNYPELKQSTTDHDDYGTNTRAKLYNVERDNRWD